MITLKEIITDYIKQHDAQWQTTLMRDWDKLVGNLKTRMCLEKIMGTTLVIGVYDPHWMHELLLLTPVLIETINEGLGTAYVTQIRLVLSRGQKRTMAPQKPLKQSAKNNQVQSRSVRPLASAQQHALAHVHDQELRDILIRFFSYCKLQ